MPTQSRIEALAEQLERYDKLYRAGSPEISDSEYDILEEQLRDWDPNNPFLQKVGAEVLMDGKTVRHKRKMLSIQKAYTDVELLRWVERVETEARAINITELQYRITPKLDGMAGNDEDGILASRGSGDIGNNITHIFDDGVVPIGGRGQGLGEVVMSLSYFEENFSEEFKHPRNMVTGFVNADEINTSTQQALDSGQIHFMPYRQLVSRTINRSELLADIDAITEQLTAAVDYPLDGMVIECTDERVKEHMGAASNNYRWQIAKKTLGETAETTILDIGWQTGRTGQVTPVLRVVPTELSGAEISNVTAHHAGMVRDKGLGVGARIIIIRSGEVIPKMLEVIEEAETVALPDGCPSCGEVLSWRGDFLMCTSSECPAQTQTGLLYFFKTLGTARGFGPSAIEKIALGGYTTIEQIYALTQAQLEAVGFSKKQAENLLGALANSKIEPVEDARFLSAFGIPHLGIGESRRLLQHHPLESVGQLTAEQIDSISGFGEKTSRPIAEQLQLRWSTISHIKALGFQLNITPIANADGSSENAVESPIAGKTILFTGEMSVTRDEMQAEARGLGAIVRSSVSGRLKIMVIGDAPSQSKLSKATKLGVQVLREEEYRTLLNGETL